jgi:hypothetical protein
MTKGFRDCRAKDVVEQGVILPEGLDTGLNAGLEHGILGCFGFITTVLYW